MAGERLRGTPQDLDVMLRPGVRLVQLMVGGAGTAVLWWFEAWWWMPVPLVASFLAYELFFWRRGDRAITVELGDRQLSVDDPVRGQHLEVPRREVMAATTWRRTLPGGRPEVVVRLDGGGGPLATFRCVGPPSARPADTDVDVDRLGGLLGGLAGVHRAVGPLDVLVRQDLEALDAAERLRAWLPEAATRRTRVRLWRGEAPQLDAFGLHVDPPDAALLLEGDTWRLLDADGGERDHGTFRDAPQGVGHRTRPTIVWVQGAEDPLQGEGELPLWLVPVGGHRLALPAPRIAEQVPQREASSDDLHTTLPEAAAVVDHWMRTLPPERWPAPLRRVASAD